MRRIKQYILLTIFTGMLTLQLHAEEGISLTYLPGTNGTVNSIPDAAVLSEEECYVSDIVPVREGYVFMGWAYSTGNAEGEVVEEAVKTSYTVRYVLSGSDTDLIDPVKVENEEVGKNIFVLAETIPGYELNGENQQSLVLTDDAESNVITFFYVKTITSYQVSYLDSETGNEISTGLTVTDVTVGNSVTVEAPSFDYWDLASEASQTIVLDADENNNSIVFKYNPRKTSYTVRYIDRMGFDIYPSKKVENINAGTTVTEYAVAVGDYTYSKEPAVIILSDTEKNEIIFYYDPVG